MDTEVVFLNSGNLARSIVERFRIIFHEHNTTTVAMGMSMSSMSMSMSMR